VRVAISDSARMESLSILSMRPAAHPNQFRYLSLFAISGGGGGGGGDDDDSCPHRLLSVTGPLAVLSSSRIDEGNAGRATHASPAFSR